MTVNFDVKKLRIRPWDTLYEKAPLCEILDIDSPSCVISQKGLRVYSVYS